MFDFKPKTLYHWYRNYLSDYQNDINSGIWLKNKIPIVDEQTGEIKSERPVYIAKPENISDSLTLDDKRIGKDSFTIMTNQKTGKIILLVETLKAEELKRAVEYLGESIANVQNISCDMSPSYLKFCEETFPDATIIIDKFHVINQVLEAVQSIRIRIKNQLLEYLPKGKKRTEADKKTLSDLELLKRSKFLLTQSESNWNDYQNELMQKVFKQFEELKTAYELSETFKQWYHKNNCKKHPIIIEKELFNWYETVENSKLKEFKSVVKMIEKHEDRILNYFQKALTNAKAENLNSKIQRFIINNYGIRDKDFALYRINKYFS